MHLLRLSLKNLRRSPRRSFFTCASLAVSLFLFATLTSVVASLDANIDAVGKLPIAVVLHRAGIGHPLPLHYAERLRTIPGVRNVVAMAYYGGTFGDSGAARDNIAAMGADTNDALRTMWGSNLTVSDEDWRAFMTERTGALIGPQLVERYGWQRGQRVTLNATLWPVDMTFTIAGTVSFRTDQAMLLFHREYLEHAAGDHGLVTLYWVEVDPSTTVPQIAALIDRELANAPKPIRTVSQQQLTQWYLGMAGDVRGLVRSLSMLVVIAVFFVTGNSIALSTRERTTEIAVLRALGFRPLDIVVCLAVEVLVLAIAGGAVGSGAAYLMFRSRGLSLGVGPLSGFHVDVGTVATVFGAAIFIALAAVLGPAVRAVRLRPVDALRKVG